VLDRGVGVGFILSLHWGGQKAAEAELENHQSDYAHLEMMQRIRHRVLEQRSHSLFRICGGAGQDESRKLRADYFVVKSGQQDMNIR